MLESGDHATLAALADAEWISRNYVCRVLRLTLLAPDLPNASCMQAGAKLGGADTAVPCRVGAAARPVHSQLRLIGQAGEAWRNPSSVQREQDLAARTAGAGHRRGDPRRTHGSGADPGAVGTGDAAGLGGAAGQAFR
jgi:hypothetical protein